MDCKISAGGTFFTVINISYQLMSKSSLSWIIFGVYMIALLILQKFGPDIFGVSAVSIFVLLVFFILFSLAVIVIWRFKGKK